MFTNQFNSLFSIKTIIVDDSTLVRERLVKMLSVLPGVKVVGEAGNSYEALNIFDKTKPHVAILDIKMPGENGVEVLKKLKKKNPSVIVIVLTNYPYTQYRTKCFENGADYFFDKSEEYNKVIDVLDDLIRTGSLNHVAVNWQY